MSSDSLDNLVPLREGVNVDPPKSDLHHLVIQVHGDLTIVEQHLSVYPRMILSRLKSGKEISFYDMNYHLWLLRLAVVPMVANYEYFLETVCRKALLQRHNLFGQFDPSLSWKDIPSSGDVNGVWEALAERVVTTLESGKLRTYVNVLKKLGVTTLSPKSSKYAALSELFERRNVIIHNGGIPDDKYLRIVKSPKTFPSGGLVIDLSYLQSAGALLTNTARDIVSQLVKKGILNKSEAEESDKKSET